MEGSKNEQRRGEEAEVEVEVEVSPILSDVIRHKHSRGQEEH